MRERLRELYARHHGFVRRVCWRYVQNPADADDLAQEILVKAALGLNGFSAECAISSWLYRVAVNHCRDSVRKRNAQKGALAKGAVTRDPFEACIGEWSSWHSDWAYKRPDTRETTAAQVLETLRKDLAGAERHILYLRFDIGMRQQGIARVTGLPRAAVRRRLARIEERAAMLYSRLEDGGGANRWSAGRPATTRFRA